MAGAGVALVTGDAASAEAGVATGAGASIFLAARGAGATGALVCTIDYKVLFDGVCYIVFILINLSLSSSVICISSCMKSTALSVLKLSTPAPTNESQTSLKC